MPTEGMIEAGVKALEACRFHGTGDAKKAAEVYRAMLSASPQSSDELVGAVARAIAHATIQCAEPEKHGRLSDRGIAEMVENLAVKFYPEARAAIAAMRPTIPDDVEVALKAADDALRNHACHGGAAKPCLRSKDQCLTECGKQAGDALLLVEQALSPRILGGLE